MGRKKHKKGKGLIENVKNTFGGIVEGAKTANKILRDTKAISKGTRLLGMIPGNPVGSVFSDISYGAEKLGYGKRRRYMRGGASIQGLVPPQLGLVSF